MTGPRPLAAVAHTADVGPERLGRIRAMLETAFDDREDGPFDDRDWTHGLGGMHAWVEQDGEITAHASVVPRRLLHGGRVLRCGYVEAVAVRGDRRRRGLGAAVMEPVERLIRSAYDVGALGATSAGRPLYVARGWLAWRGPLSGLTLEGVRATPGEVGTVHVLPVEAGAALDLDAELTCDWREGELW